MSPQYQRLVWKEFRSLAPFWLALLAGHLLICVSSALTLERTLPLYSVLTSVATVVWIGFALGSTMLAFSGEEDHGTSLLLRMMPARTSTLLFAKVSVIVVGTLALVVACLGVNAPLSMLSDGASQVVPRPGSAAEVSLFGLSVLVGFAGCLMFSLRCRRVITAFGWATVLLGLLFPLVLTAQLEHRVGPVAGAMVVVLVVAVLLVLRQARVWHLRPPGWTLRFRQPGWVDSSAVLGTVRRRTAGLSRLLLTWSATRPTVPSRTVAVLGWQEAREAFLFAAVTVGVVQVLFILQELTRGFYIPTELVLLVVAMEAGLRTFRRDQQRLNGLFWSHRGVSPLVVWAVRNAVWLPATLMLLTALICLESVTRLAVDPLVVGGIWPRLFQEETILGKLQHHAAYSQAQNALPSVGLLLYRCMGGLLGVFVVCELCSCWIRKPLLAAFSSLLAVAMWLAWLTYVVSFNMPLMLLAWPLVLVVFLAVPMTRRQWMDRRSGVLLQLQRWGSVVVPALSVCVLSQVWWAFEIPEPHPASRFTGAAETPGLYESLGYSKENASGEWAEAWFRLQNTTPGIQASLSTINEGATSDDDEARRREAVEVIDQVLLLLEERPRQLPSQWRVPRSSFGRAESAAVVILLDEAERLRNDADTAASFRRLSQAVQLSRFWMSQSTDWAHWFGAMHYEKTALQAIRDAAVAEAVTEEQLARLRQDLAVRTEPEELQTVAINRFAILDQLLRRRGYLWDWYQRQPSRIDLDVDFLTLSWAQRERLQRLNAIVSNQDGELSPHQLASWIDTDKASKELFAGTVSYSRSYSQHLDSWGQSEYWTLLAERRATQVIIALQQYRRRHGAFPENLYQLTEVGLATNDPSRRDPWLDAEFGYARDGYGRSLPMQTLDTKLKFLSPQQPLLWCHGPIGPHQRSELQKPAALPERPLTANEVIWLEGTSQQFAPTKIYQLKQAIETAIVEAREAEQTSGDVPAKDEATDFFTR